jgi:predicted nucleic acid-binding protein
MEIMTNKSVLLDKNIVIDLILGRARQSKISSILNQFDKILISTNTFTTCFYILRKSEMSKEQIYSDLTQFELVEIDKADCHLAYDLAQNIDDIEDCLELYTAKRNKSKLITADRKMIFKYSNLVEMIEIE